MKPTECSHADSARNKRLPFFGSDTLGFTRVDLLVIIATLAMLAIMLLPALAKNRVKPQGTQCFSNLRQITTGWLMYVDDNNGNFPINASGSPALNWVSGVMDYTGGNGDTNYLIMVDPKLSQLAPYVQNPVVYRCPADQSTQYAFLLGPPRVRSYSMSGAIGCKDLNGTPRTSQALQTIPAPTTSGNWLIYTRTAQMSGGLGPSDIWLLVDEHPDSITDAVFQNLMPQFIGEAKWWDVPAKWHNNACVFSFADGHSEIHRWQSSGQIPNPVYHSPNIGNGEMTTQATDVLWFYNHTTVPARAF